MCYLYHFLPFQTKSATHILIHIKWIVNSCWIHSNVLSIKDGLWTSGIISHSLRPLLNTVTTATVGYIREKLCSPTWEISLQRQLLCWISSSSRRTRRAEIINRTEVLTYELTRRILHLEVAPSSNIFPLLVPAVRLWEMSASIWLAPEKSHQNYQICKSRGGKNHFLESVTQITKNRGRHF